MSDSLVAKLGWKIIILSLLKRARWYILLDMEKEIWKVIKDLPAYRVSSLGKIQSRWRRGKKIKNKFKNFWETRKTHTDKKGYARLAICDGIHKPVTTLVHVLVAESFIGKKPFKRSCVRHLDGNPKNNKAENLAWGSHWENEQDKKVNGTWENRNGGAKLTPNKVSDIRAKAKSGTRQEDLAKEYDVSRPTITRIVNKTIWKLTTE